MPPEYARSFMRQIRAAIKPRAGVRGPGRPPTVAVRKLAERYGGSPETWKHYLAPDAAHFVAPPDRVFWVLVDNETPQLRASFVARLERHGRSTSVNAIEPEALEADFALAADLARRDRWQEVRALANRVRAATIMAREKYPNDRVFENYRARSGLLLADTTMPTGAVGDDGARRATHEELDLVVALLDELHRPDLQYRARFIQLQLMEDRGRFDPRLGDELARRARTLPDRAYLEAELALREAEALTKKRRAGALPYLREALAKAERTGSAYLVACTLKDVAIERARTAHVLMPALHEVNHAFAIANSEASPLLQCRLHVARALVLAACGEDPSADVTAARTTAVRHGLRHQLGKVALVVRRQAEYRDWRAWQRA